MRLVGFRVSICRACAERAAYRAGLCRNCLRLFSSEDMTQLDWFFNIFFGAHMRENDEKPTP